MKDLDYNLVEEKFEMYLAGRSEMSVATSYKDHVTVRTVFVVCRGLTVFFLTRRSSNKYKQLVKNSRIGLCFENVQIEGTAEILGHPTDIQNTSIVEYCLEHGYDGFERYMKYKNCALIEVQPLLIGSWMKMGREYLDLENSKAYRIG